MKQTLGWSFSEYLCTVIHSFPTISSFQQQQAFRKLRPQMASILLEENATPARQKYN